MALKPFHLPTVPSNIQHIMVKALAARVLKTANGPAHLTLDELTAAADLEYEYELLPTGVAVLRQVVT